MSKTSNCMPLQAKIDQWLADLPPELQFDDPTSCSVISGNSNLSAKPTFVLTGNCRLSPHGIHSRPLPYHLDHSCACRMHLKMSTFYATLAQFTDLAIRSRKAIDWMDRNEYILEGWCIMPYSLFICSLIQVFIISKLRFRD